MDKLDNIYDLQYILMKRLNVPINIDQMPTYMFALYTELGEVAQLLNWKPWKKTKKEVDIEHLQEELIDCLHFLMELMILSGMTSEQIKSKYIAKNDVNFLRQEQGY